MSDNPFFESWTTPFGIPPFDRIRPEHFPPAFDRGMAEQIAEIEGITGNPEAPGFANTIEAMERGGKLLGQVCRVFFNLNSSHTSDAIQAIALDYSPKLAQHNMRVSLDPALFARVSELYERRASLGLAPDQMRLLERYRLGFVRSGAALPPAERERMAAISERLATLHTLFGQNVLHDEKEWQLVLEEAELDGLPDFMRAAAAQAARERGLEGKYVITLSRSSVEPFLTFSERRDLRKTAYTAWLERGGHDGAHDNKPIIREIVALRAERARLLGYATYADYKFDDTMAKTPAAAAELLAKVWEPAKEKAAAERAELQAQAAAEGVNEGIAPWDWRHYAEKVRKAKYELDEAEVKPYFVLDNMVRAAFDTATRLFGVTFAERTDVPLYHPDVRVYEVREGERHVGLFIHDNFARAEKRSGAWMSSYRDYESFDGTVTPIIVNNNNFAKGEPTLLSFDEAETLFHEFGHGLHGLLSNARYPSQSGTSVRRDFVEFPSQVYEHWMAAPENLRKYAVHYKTGQPIPDELLGRLLAARTFNQGFGTVEYTAAALLDLEFHTHPDPGSLDVPAFEREVLAKIGMPAEIAVRHRPAHFQHLFAGDGYAAGYYAYLWAEVLDADGFEAFAEAGNMFDPALSARLKDIYQAGDTRDPMELYVAFRGREPRIEALLKHRGLTAKAA
ncbi:M3 family metallopeptidase [Azospirillum sp. SYSU D00513]|uniref:M3 family metallopeptidase n=1 Tax=Azospirillum sp. SYSU D00513 TaxID=2812561 RepID=UPI001A973D0B|nr:M3 family metallopeptidase [Azospirillum sp. SYSU D00513]